MTSEAEIPPLPNGEAGAAVLACGIGVCTFGLVVLLAEASSGLAQALNFMNPVGPLSGKVIIALVVWLLTWGILQKLWNRRQVNFGRIKWIAFALIFIGFVLTFPPVFGVFSH